MRKCIDSLLVGGDDVEVVIVNDGSKDKTAEIADEYAARFPGIVKAVHQENGGHGEAVNAGLRHASGMYYKVVDSDDWLDEESLLRVIGTLKQFVADRKRVDLMICNYVYEHVTDGTHKAIRYTNVLPQERIFGWSQVKRFRVDQNLLMHSLIYRTKVLRDCGFELPKHTFYVDNLFAYVPLPYVRSLYYMDVDLYRYYIGREDQSVNEQVMIGRIDQQIRVTKLMLGYYDVTKIQNRKLRHYMVRYLEIMMVICSILAIRSGEEENMEKKKELWESVRKTNMALYLRLRWGFLGQGMNLPGKGGRSLSIAGYKIAQKFFGFN